MSSSMPLTPGTVTSTDASSRAAAFSAPASFPVRLTSTSRPGGPRAHLCQGQRFETRREHDALAPLGDEFGVARLAAIGLDELHPEARELVAPRALLSADALLLAEAGDRKVDQLLAEVRLGLVQGALQVVDESFHPLRRSAGREAHAGEQDISLGGGEEVEGDPVAPQQADGEQHRGESEAERGPGPADRGGHQTPEGTVAEPSERAVEPAPECADSRGRAPSKREVQVAGQYQEALDQGSDDHADHHQRNVEQDLPDDAAHQHQRHERGHRGQ